MLKQFIINFSCCSYPLAESDAIYIEKHVYQKNIHWGSRQTLVNNFSSLKY